MDISLVDMNRRENIRHGTEGFPFTVYEDRYFNNFYPGHWHDEIEIGYVKKGRVTLTTDQEIFVLEEGSGIFLNNGTLHTVGGWGEQEAVFPNIVFHPSFVYGSMESVLYEKYLSPLLNGPELSCLLLSREISWQREILELSEKVIETERNQEWGYEFRIRNLLSEILLLILHNSADVLKEVPGNDKHRERIRCMVTYIKKYYGEDIRLKDIASAASIGERECLRCFHSFMGKPPKQFVREIRLGNAEKLLGTTTFSIKEIGERCGFRDSGYFSRVFHDEYGISPREYRKNIVKLREKV